MKKKMIAWLVVILLLAGALYCGYMELCFSGTTIVDSGLTSQEVLREMPDIDITYEDLVLAQNILKLPQVEALADADNVSVDLSNLPPDLVEEGQEIQELSVIRGQVHLSLSPEETRSIRYVFVPGYDIGIQKVIGIYEIKDGQSECTALYTNDPRGITKMVPKHLWFSWLTLK